MSKFLCKALVLLIVALSGPAYAVPVEYDFSATWSFEAEGPITDFLIPGAPTNFFGSGDTVSGSFFYDSTVPVNPMSSGPTGYPGAMTNLSGSINGNLFSDSVGVATVDPNVDRVGLLAEPGINRGPLPIRNISGFTIGEFALANVRLFWQDLANDVITDDPLPPGLPPPGFELGDARVALDFVNGPLDSPDTLKHLVFFENLTVATVPEPSTILLLGSGLAGLAGWRRKQRHTTNTS